MGRFAEVIERCMGCGKAIKRSTTEKPKGLVKGKIVVVFCEKCQAKNEENKPPGAA
jgi:uncharacterized protein with PIN domain